MESNPHPLRLLTCTAVLASLIGCASPQPQVVYVPYPQHQAPTSPAPPPSTSTHPVDPEDARSWRRFCIETASEVDQYVWARDEGLDFSAVRDWALEREVEGIQAIHVEARTRADRELVDDIAELTLMMTQRLVQQVYQRPYGDVEQERALWIENCMTLIE